MHVVLLAVFIIISLEEKKNLKIYVLIVQCKLATLVIFCCCEVPACNWLLCCCVTRPLCANLKNVASAGRWICMIDKCILPLNNINIIIAI